jgi:hypothetical protein
MAALAEADWRSLLSGEGWSTTTQAEVAARLSQPGLGRWLSQVRQVRQCARPVRLVGGNDTIDTTTGEVLGSYSASSEPDGGHLYPLREPARLGLPVLLP